MTQFGNFHVSEEPWNCLMGLFVFNGHLLMIILPEFLSRLDITGLQCSSPPKPRNLNILLIMTSTAVPRIQLYSPDRVELHIDRNTVEQWQTSRESRLDDLDVQRG